jgi:hypothetical protein
MEKTLPLRGRVEFLLAFGCSPENTISTAYGHAGVNQHPTGPDVKHSSKMFFIFDSSFG